jgi:hypothetical protein
LGVVALVVGGLVLAWHQWPEQPIRVAVVAAQCTLVTVAVPALVAARA